MRARRAAASGLSTAKIDLWHDPSTPLAMLQTDIWTSTFRSAGEAAVVPLSTAGLTATTWFPQKPYTSTWRHVPTVQDMTFAMEDCR